MKTTDIWSETIPPPDNQDLTNSVWSCCFSPDGATLLAVVGDALLVYDAMSGQMVKPPIRNKHKGNIYCISYSQDGKRFATGGADRNVIIWKNNFEAELKFHQGDSIQCLSFNPVSGQIFSGCSTDYALWTPDQGEIEKDKVNSKINCCAWSPDGQHIAYGLANGSVNIKTKKLSEKGLVRRNGQVWCLAWTPVTSESTESSLVVGSWDQTISIYDFNGKQIGAERKLTFDPLSISFFSNGEFFVLGGTNKKASLWTKELNYLDDVSEKKGWVWDCKVKPKQNMVALTTEDGNIAMHDIKFTVVHGIYQERYVSRHLLTDIVVQHLVNEHKTRIKCKDLVQKVSIYKNRLAVQMPEKIYIYVVSTDDHSGMKYKLYKKIMKKFVCSLLVVTSANLLLCQENKLILVDFEGETQREWVFESLIKYVKPFGGAPKREGLLIGLQNGDAFQVFIDNPFPIQLVRQSAPIRIVDISLSRRKLAVVDENSVLNVYDLATKELLYQEMNVVSAAWNTDMDDLLAYSGGGLLSIRMGNLPATTQRMNGFIVGFKGSKLFFLYNYNMVTMDIPQTSSLIKYIENKDFKSAYQVACLGITEQDFKSLGIEALQNGDFEIARRCFLRIKEMPLIELLQKYEQEKRSGEFNPLLVQAEVMAYQGKFTEAGEVLKKANRPEKAVELFTVLRRWDDADKFSVGGGNRRDLLRRQATIANDIGEWEKAGDLSYAAGDYVNAVELYGAHGKIDKLVLRCREMDKNEHEEAIRLSAFYFRKNNQHSYAKEAYLKLGDMKALMQLHIELARWDEAFLLAKTNPEFDSLIHQPYAEWLEKNDRFSDAQKEYKIANRPDLSMRILEKLSRNATLEQRFGDVGGFLWSLATENLRLVKNAKNPDFEDTKHLERFHEFNLLSDVYYAYNSIHEFIENPFHHTGGNYQQRVFNACRFILSKLGSRSPLGISKIYLYYALAKISKALEAFQTARIAYERLSSLRIPLEWVDEIETGNLLVRSKPFSDKETLYPVCDRCANPNQLISEDERCSACFHPFTRSFISFENLPLVEFKLDKGMTHRKFMELLNTKQDGDSPGRRKHEDATETTYGNQQTLTLHQHNDMDSTPFIDKMNQVCEMQVASQDYVPIVVNETIVRSLNSDEIYFVNLTKYCSSYDITYYKNMLPDVPLKTCEHCNKFFILDEYEFALLEERACPFCKTPVLNEGENPPSSP